MSEKEIRDKLVEAVKSNPHRDEIRKISLFGSYASGILMDQTAMWMF